MHTATENLKQRHLNSSTSDMLGKNVWDHCKNLSFISKKKHSPLNYKQIEALDFQAIISNYKTEMLRNVCISELKDNKISTLIKWFPIACFNL